MTIKTKDFFAFPKTNKAKKGSFFELAKRNIIKSKKIKKGTLSRDVDMIVYGK